MALTTVESGTKSTTVPADAALLSAPNTTAGIYVAMWNLTNLAKGDIIRLWVVTKVLTGDTAETVFEGVYANDQLANCIVMSPAIVSMFSIDMYLNQTAGSTRNIPWSLIRIST